MNWSLMIMKKVFFCTIAVAPIDAHLSSLFQIVGTWTPFNPETIRLMMGKAKT